MTTIKEELLENCKRILYSTPVGTPVTNEAYDYLTNIVFPLHKNWKEKLSGRSIKLIITKRNDYGSQYFSMLMDDDTFENISIYECINRKGLKEDIISAAGEAVKDIPCDSKKPFPGIVKDWIRTFGGEEFEIGKYLVNNDSKVYFENQDLVNNFRSYYTQNG